METEKKTITQGERMELARNEILENNIVLPEEKWEVAKNEFVVRTSEFGFVRIKLVAVKDLDFDPEEAERDFLFDLETKRKNAEETKAKKEKAKKANIEKKERLKAQKGWPEKSGESLKKVALQTIFNNDLKKRNLESRSGNGSSGFFFGHNFTTVQNFCQ